MTTVRTTAGAIRGTREGDLMVFRGIPYALPPFGALRFAAPDPAVAWDGVLEATAFGPAPPRTGHQPPYDRFFPDPVVTGEDCLTVNVWTPDAAASDLPVMVWFYGGAFRNGFSAEPLYDGAALAAAGVVVVSCNYRTGLDGFGLIDGAPPNRGLRDQLAALRWVRDNVRAFGGDPGAVTAFGESAGAMSICTLLAIPESRGLVHRAIVQSGSGEFAQPPETARTVLEAVAGHLGVPATRDGLAGAGLPALARAQAAVGLAIAVRPDPARWGRLARDNMPFEPVVDGDLLPAPPADLLRAGAGADVPILTGTTTDEWRFFTVPAGLRPVLGEAHAAAAAALYGLADTAPYPAAPAERFEAILTDWFFRIPAIRLAEARADGPAATHLYELRWPSPAFGGALGACHALDLPFVFDTLDTGPGRALAGDDPPRALGAAMRRAWVAFARTGDPGWPPYTPQHRRVMAFDGDGTTVVEDPAPQRRAAWAGRR